MPAIRTHDPVVDDMDDDDGMPPLVDNPNPSMNFTFFTDMRPITYSPAESTRFEVLPDTFTISTPPSSPEFPDSPTVFQDAQEAPRTSHGRKRDASYIPRPPNAFILFRSSFIKSQQVPGKVEGNHSTLSKIIGLYWRTLPRQEREVWEAKAVVAQAEHRKKYPDWRFRPGANAMAKLKIKDGPGTGRKRNTNKSKDDAGGMGQNRRCAKIADLLQEGKTGEDLEAAVKEWDVEDEKESRLSKAVVKKGKRGGVRRGKGITDSVSTDDEGDKRGRETQAKAVACAQESEALKARSTTPGAVVDSRFKVPLTAMFKRSLSAPAAHGRAAPDAQSASHIQPRGVPSPLTVHDMSLSPSSDYLPALSFDHSTEVPRTVNELNVDFYPQSPPAYFNSWDDPYSPFDSPMTFPVDNAGWDYSLENICPPQSPSDYQISSFPSAFPNIDAHVSKPDLMVDTMSGFPKDDSYPGYTSTCYSSPSSYSSLKGWAGETLAEVPGRS